MDEKGEVTAQWWIEPFERDTTILVVGNHDRLVVDPEGVIPEVNRDNKTASIFLTLHTGPLYRMGNFSYGDVPVDSALIDKQMNWTIGERFSQRHVIELQKRLLDTRYFSSVRLEQRVDKANRRVDIHAHLHMRKRNAVDLGIGFATDTGPRANIAWNKPWFNSRGHSVQLKSGSSGIAYDTAITYRIPTKSKRDRYWQSDFYLGELRIEPDAERSQKTLMIGLGHRNAPSLLIVFVLFYSLLYMEIMVRPSGPPCVALDRGGGRLTAPCRCRCPDLQLLRPA